MTDKQKMKLNKLEQDMRDQAIGINNCSVKMQEIDATAAIKALQGIIEYLQEAIYDIDNDAHANDSLIHQENHF